MRTGGTVEHLICQLYLAEYYLQRRTYMATTNQTNIQPAA